MAVVKRILRPGQGPAITSGQLVTAHVTGYGKDKDLLKEFWSTKEMKIRRFQRPLTFKIGQGHVIRGLDEGVLGMRLGERAFLVCTPDDAFGAGGCTTWGIQPNSLVAFDLEVIAIE